MAAANKAMPGDIITVHGGTYRERVTPPRGGESNTKRIVYRAASGEKVIITGSEIVKGWTLVSNNVWKVTLPNSFFDKFNPYEDLIHGDWFTPDGRDSKNKAIVLPATMTRKHHTGAVYLNGHWLNEAAHWSDLFSDTNSKPVWSCNVTLDNTTIWAQFPGINPNEQNVEINVRQTVFTPEKTGMNYITVSGFDMRNAATPWAPPSAGQIGIISAYWNKGWIIENNEVSYSKCAGIALGKYGDKFDNTNDGGAADPYTDCVLRAIKDGWSKDKVGSHIVRNNHIHHCEQVGIVGSLGCAFSTITGNEIHDIHVERLYSGWEQAGIKFHGAVDVTISNNHIYRCGFLGLWLDWMCQGVQVTGNLLHDNRGDGSLEMQHGPMLLANNLFLSAKGFDVASQGIAFVHNIIAGNISYYVNDGRRVTPVLVPHSTAIASFYPSDSDDNGDSGDGRFYNNLFIGGGNLNRVDKMGAVSFLGGNVYTKGTLACKLEVNPLLDTGFDTNMKIVEKKDGWYLSLSEKENWKNKENRKVITTAFLGKAKVSGCAYENADGSPLIVNKDYLGKKRNEKDPFPGPFETPVNGEIKVWSK
ncbi:hypothetical protein FEM08_09620 [Flavobacterium gilvum]|nr:hypothetical protein FEM08_09620 [Flavobacterium gilvum]